MNGMIDGRCAEVNLYSDETSRKVMWFHFYETFTVCNFVCELLIIFFNLNSILKNKLVFSQSSRQ
jgi:hypothetical protein